MTPYLPRRPPQGSAETGGPLVTLWFRYDWLMAAGARTSRPVSRPGVRALSPGLVN